jgi:hypothetical protein
MSSSPHIVVRVAPRLLGDVLCLALRGEGLDVELCLDDDPKERIVRSKRFDLAIVTEPLPGDVVADTVLVLDPSGAKLVSAGEEQDRPLDGDDQLAGLIAIVDGVLGEDTLG